MEPQEAAEKLQNTQRILNSFVGCYDEYKLRSIKAAPENPWRFSSAVLFRHLDVFRQRLADLLDICQTAVQFSRLERIEVGGSQVRPTLSVKVRTHLS
jgi:dynein heavy chain